MKQRSDLAIRDAYDTEREAIREVTRAAYAEYATLMPPLFWEAYWQQVSTTLDEQGPIERIVAVDATGIVGSVLLYPPFANAYSGLEVNTPAPEVRLLSVLPSARGQGIGVALMNECVRRARFIGATQLGLHTMDAMQAAVRMYERMGFEYVPSLDFRPAAGIVVKGYYLRLNDA